MLMERLAEVIRGWPYDGSLDRAEPIKAGVTLQNGDWVTKASGDAGALSKVGASPAALAGLVVVGNGDSASAANANEAVVLWRNFIAKIANYDVAGTYTPGTALTVKNGVLTPANGTTDPVIAFVLEVVAGATGLNPQTAHITVVSA